MNCARVLLLLLVCGCPWRLSGAQTRAPRQGRTEFSTRGYARLSDWARANGFELRWSRAGDALQLSNRFWQMVFPRDSREAELGGVHVCLSYPVLVRDGVAYISQTDLDTAIRPLLLPPKNTKGSRIRTIVIDPGHGGKDPGNIVGSQQEKRYTLLLAQELCDQLRRAGFNASLTRTADTFIPLPDRPEIARRRGADLFISVHWNELPGNREMKGAQTFCLTPAGASSSNAGRGGIGAGRSPGNRNDEKNVLLASALQKSLLGNVGVEDRGVRRARYWILRDATMPAALIEGGFMSNPAEANRIYDAGYRRQMAHAIVEGIRAYQRQVE
jgi:N-acetylmuramoyl-L-alanine amidase